MGGISTAAQARSHCAVAMATRYVLTADDVLCYVSEVVRCQLEIAHYEGQPPANSPCIDLNIPDIVAHDQPLEITGSVDSGTINALAVEFDDGPARFALTECNLTDFTESFETDLPAGTYGMTVVDWTNDTECSVLIYNTIDIEDSIADMNVSTLPAVAVRGETVVELTTWEVQGSVKGGTVVELTTWEV